MTNKIFTRDSDVGLVHKHNSIELKGWINQLQYIDNEISKLVNLYAHPGPNNRIPKNISFLLSKRKESNQKLYKTVLAYSNEYSNVVECNDI